MREEGAQKTRDLGLLKGSRYAKYFFRGRYLLDLLTTNGHPINP
jgi:hypothetical protein